VPTNLFFVLTPMKIFLDFDDTLVQTTNIFGRAFKSVVAVNGAFPQKVHPIDFSRLPGDGKPLVTPERYIEQFDLTPEQQVVATQSIGEIVSQIGTMLFADVEGFLAHFPAADLAILTYGDAAFQRAKIQHSGLTSRVPEVHITSSQSKCAYIADLALSMGFSATIPLVLIDDKKEYFDDQNDYGYHIVGVWLDRENRGGTHSATVRVTSLTEAAMYLRGLDSGLAKV